MAVNTSFISTTAAGYQVLLDDVVTFVTNDQINTVAINNGGTGYAVGDIITLSGGTFLVAATFRVTAEAAGVITALEVFNAGSYSVNTGATGIATTGGNADATVDVTYQTPWTAERKIDNEGAVKAIIVSGGTGHAVNDTLTGVSGTGTKYTLNVDAVATGVVTQVSVVTNGNYTVAPTSPDTTTTDGSGTGATFTITMSGEQGQKEVLLKGIGSGSDEIYTGIRTYEDVSENAQNWELAGMTGHDLELPYGDQPNISPGRHTDATSSQSGGSFVPLSTIGLTYWLNVTGRRIKLTVRVSTRYSDLYLGFWSPFGTLTEIPYPLCVGGCVSQPDTRFDSSREGYASVAFPVAKAHVASVVDPGDLKNGPIMLRLVTGEWATFANAFELSTLPGSSSVYTLRVLTPPGRANPNISRPEENDSWISNTVDWEAFAGLTNVATPSIEMRVTPDTGGDLSPLIPQAFEEIGNNSNPTLGDNVLGELEGVKWAPIFGTSIVAEDTVTVNGIVHRLFPSGGQTEAWHFYAVEER